MIVLGNIVRDSVTGFKGTAVARIEYINGCIQFCVLPTVVDNKMPEGVYIDYQRLEFVETGVALPSSDTGGAMHDTPSSSYRG